jgi:Amidohydrolase family
VAERIAAGSDYLKIISGTGCLWPSLGPETIRALVIAAHARGLVVVAHVSSTAGVEEVVSAGVDVTAHVPANAELDKALVERMAEAGIAVGPTLATIENILGEPGGAAVAGDPRLAEVLGETWVRRLTSDASGWHGRPMPPYSRAEENVRRLADAGVTLLAGTDAPNPGTVFGANLHRELELLVRCGISPAQALAAATAEPARVFGLAGRGRVAVGQRADLVLVSGDPLTDITATRAIERIWRGGTACDRHAFAASAAEAEQLDAFDAQLAKSWQPCANAGPTDPTGSHAPGDRARTCTCTPTCADESSAPARLIPGTPSNVDRHSVKTLDRILISADHEPQSPIGRFRGGHRRESPPCRSSVPGSFSRPTSII